MFSFLRPSSSGPGKRVEAIAPPDAVARAARGEILVIDVRDAGELRATGKARGALHVPMVALRMKCDPASPEFLPALAARKPVALYCASGGRSQAAARQLLDLGYDKVYNIGGLRDWVAGGGAVER